jgi:hypothetical protein
MTDVGEKLSTDPWIGHPASCGLGREPFFSGIVDLFNSVDDLVKDCHVRRLPVGSIREMARKAYVSYVLGFLCRVHIDSNYRDSRI